MDLAVLIIIIILVAIIFKDIKWIIFSVGTIEIFLRLVNYIGNNIGIKKVATFINNIFPDSIFSIIDTYSTGIINVILCWVLVVIFCWFFIYLLLYLFKRS